MEASPDLKNPVLHVVVVAFHHKKGCQVEYSYPPLLPGRPVNSSECPEEWKQLPSLALPDGAHNFAEDTVYFHLPSRDVPRSTVYCVSCYRQMQATEVLNPTADVTRNSVQKSVCVLSKLPVYGLIQAKLELITHAYFQGRDFSQVALLEDTYKTLNISLTESLLQDSQVFVGLSCRELLQKFQHKLVILFKLMLLERRVLFYSSPVRPICTTILSLASLFPGMIERGLVEAASYSSKCLLSPTLRVTNVGDVGGDFLEICYRDDDRASPDKKELVVNKRKASDWSELEDVLPQRDVKSSELTFIPCLSGSAEDLINANDTTCGTVENQSSTESPGVHSSTKADLFGSGVASRPHLVPDNVDQTNAALTVLEENGQRTVPADENIEICRVNSEKNSQAAVARLATSNTCAGSTRVVDPHPPPNLEDLLETEDEIVNWTADQLMLEIDEALNEGGLTGDVSPAVAGDNHTPPLETKSSSSVTADILSFLPESIHGLTNSAKTSSAAAEPKHSPLEILNVSPTSLVADDFGFPLAIFTKGMLLHPYLSLHLYDLLTDVNVRGFVIGATNALFRQKTHLSDVVVEVGETKIDIHDPELRRQLTLTTADLRFADHLVRSISDDRGDIYLDSTEWEGGDDWLRAQFKAYLLSLVRTVSSDDERLSDDFNENFVAAWKTTHNYRQWKHGHKSRIDDIPVGHPFHGQLAMSDVKLRLAQVIQNADRNKKINAVVSQTGRVVTQTGKAVGGALNSAKSAVTTWFGNFGGNKS